MADDQIVEEVSFVGDPSSLSRLEATLASTFDQIASKLGDSLEKGFRDAFAGVQTAVDRIQLVQTIDEQATKGAKSVHQIVEELAKAKTSAAAVRFDAGHSLEDAAKDTQALLSRIQAVERDARNIELIDPAQFAVLDRAQDKLLALSRNIKQALSEGTANPELRRQFQAEFEALSRIAVSESKNIQSALRNATAAENRDTREAVSVQAAAARERLALIRNEGAQRARQLRTSGELELAAEKANGKARVANLQTVGRLLIDVERGIGTALAATARTGVSGLARLYSDTFGKIPGLIRSNGEEQVLAQKEIDAKLEREISRSTKERTTIVQQQLTRQEALAQRATTQANTGLTGLATGRSNLANAVGFGGLIGGGFALFSALKSGITDAQDFNQTMAVLQQQLGLTNAQMEEVSKTSVQLGNDLSLPGVSAKDAGDAINILTRQFGSLGKGAVTAATAAAKGTLQLARATRSSADDAAALIGSAVNVFGIGADKAVAVADAITGALAKAAGVSFSEFKDAFVQGATVFEQFVGPAESANDVLIDFNTTLAVLAKNGITGSNAGAGLKQFFLQANKDGEKSVNVQKELVKRAGETGTVFFTAAGKARDYSESLDIIRKGVQGYSDAQRSAALSSLFGARSITIANALIKTSSAEYEKLRASIQQQGIAAKVAAAQNQGLRGAMDALSSVIDTQILLAFRALDKPLGNVVVGVAAFVNTLASGTGIYAVVRDGLKGIAVALGALLAVKAAVEVFQLLGLALGSILTPMGLFITAFAAAGALITILNKRSESFHKAFQNVLRVVGDLGSKLKELIGDRLQKLGDFLNQTGIPAMERFGDAALKKVGPALDAIAEFASGTALPALKTLSSIVTDLAVKGFGALNDVFHNLLPVLKPIGQFFADIGSSLASAGGNLFAGKFADAFGDLQSVGSTIKAGLGPVLADIGDFFVTKFNEIKESLKNVNWAEVGGSVLDGIKFVGKQIGNFLTDPKTLGIAGGTAGAIVAAAALIAANFVTGLAQGISSNIPELARIVKENMLPVGKAMFEGIIAGIKLAFQSPEAIVAVIAGVALQRKLKTAFSQMGRQAATGFTDGIGGVRGVRGGGFGGVLLGNDAEQVFGLRLAKLRSTAQREIGAINRVFKVSGTPLVDNILPTSGVAQIQSRLDTARQAFQTFGERVGPTAAKAFNLKASFASGFNIKNIVDDMRLKGISVGQAFATAAVSTITSALSGAALGKGDVIGGLAGIIGSGIAAGAATGNPAIGAGVAGVGLLTAAFTAHAEAAKKAKAEVKEYTDAVVGAGDAAGVTAGVLKTLNSELQTQGTGTLKALSAIGFSTSDLADAAAKGKGAVEDFFSSVVAPDVLGKFPVLAQAFEELGVSVQDFGELAAKGKVDELIGQIVLLGGPTLGAVKSELSAAGISVEDLGDAFQFMGKEAAQALTGIDNANLVDGITKVKDATKEMDEEAQKKVIQGVLEGAKTAADNAAGAFDKANIALQKLVNPRDNTLKQGIDQAIVSAGDFGKTLQTSIEDKTAVGAANVRLQFDGLSQQIGELLSTGIKEGTVVDEASARTALQPFETAILSTVSDPLIAATIKGAFENGFRNVDPTVGAKKAADAATNAKTAIDSAFGETPVDVPVKVTPPAGAELAGLVESVGATIPPVKVPVQLTQDLLNGANATNLQAASALESRINPIKIPTEVTPPPAGQATSVGATAGGQVVSGFTGADFGQISGATTGALSAAGAAGAAVAGISGFAAGAAFTGGVASAINSTSGQVSAAASSAIGSATGSAQGSASSNGQSIGAALAQGISVGIRNNAGQAAAAAAAMVTAAANAARQAAQIASPSKVFADIGKQITAGLAKGIAENGDDVAAAVESVIQALVDKASGASSIIKAGGQQIRESLFDLLFNQQVTVKLAVDTEQAKEALASGIFGLQDQVKGAADAKLQAQIAKAFGKGAPLSAADREAFFSNPNSLSLGDKLGIQNRAAIVSQVEQIKQFGQALIDNGASAASAVAQMKAYKAQLIAQATALGFNKTQITNLVASLGLSDAALNNFVKQVNDASKGLTAAQKAAAQAAKFAKFAEKVANGDFNLDDDTQIVGASGVPTRRSGNLSPVVGVLNVNLPTGDPHANALEVANRLAMVGAV